MYCSIVVLFASTLAKRLAGKTSRILCFVSMGFFVKTRLKSYFVWWFQFIMRIYLYLYCSLLLVWAKLP